MAKAYSSPELKLEWAKTLFKVLKQKHDEFILSKPYELRYHPYATDGTAGFSLESIQPPPLELLTTIGDVIHNARAALDHLAFAIAEHANPEAHTNKLYGVTFPLEFDQSRWESTAGRMKLLPEAVQDKITELQPFNAGIVGSVGIATPQMLGRLNQLERADKHRVISPVFAGTGGMREPELPPPLSARRGRVSMGVVNEGDEVATWLFDGAVPGNLPADVDVYSLIPVALCFPDEIFVGSENAMKVIVYDVINTLSLCIDAVGDVQRILLPCISGGAPLP